MFDWFFSFFRGATAQLTFLSICIAGAIISGFSLLFGGGDADADGHDTDGGDAGGHDGDHGGDHHHEGPKLVSIRSIALFATGFGAVGYVIQRFTDKILVSSVSGMVGGLTVASIGLLFIRAFYRQQASSLISQSQIIGATGVVIISVPKSGEGVGEVNLNVGGVQHTAIARTNGESVPVGQAVRVVRILGSTVEVERVA